MAKGPQIHNLPLVGDFMANPNEEAKLKGMRQAGAMYGAARAPTAQARMNALSNQMAAYQPANNALATLYGSQNSIDPSMMLRSPFTGQGPQPAPQLAPPAATPPAAGEPGSDIGPFGTRTSLFGAWARRGQRPPSPTARNALPALGGNVRGALPVETGGPGLPEDFFAEPGSDIGPFGTRTSLFGAWARRGR